jgi:hypothetical protein
MLLALNYADVPSFLDDSNHDISTLQKLQQQMRSLPVIEIRAAIDDVLRPHDEKAEYVTVLDIRVYKVSSGYKLPFHAWGHVFAFRQCSGCARSLCRTVRATMFNPLPLLIAIQADEIVDYSRHALLTGSAPFGYALPQEMSNVPGVAVLAICGLIFEFPQTDKRVSVSKRIPEADKTTIWEEEKNPPMLSGALSPSDPYAQDFLNELLRRCLSYKHLAVMLRKSKAELVIRSAAKIVGRFRRTSQSVAGLMKARWLPAFFYTDSLIEASRPHNGCRLTPGMPPSDFDCMQFVVLNGFNGDNDERYIVEDLLVLWKVVYDCETVLELCHAIAKPYIEDGELEPDAERPERPFIPNLERGFAAYNSLWGSFPRWMKEHEPTTFPTIWPTAERWE